MKSQASRELAGLNGASDASADQASIDDRRGDRMDLVATHLRWTAVPTGALRERSIPLLYIVLLFYLILRNI